MKKIYGIYRTSTTEPIHETPSEQKASYIAKEIINKKKETMEWKKIFENHTSNKG